jgi:hypothetical protein
MVQSPDPRDNEIVKVFHFIKWGRADYIAARTLLLSGLLVQGAGLANTAIEKFLKAQCVQMGVASGKTHDVGTLYTLVRSQAAAFALNEGFLRAINKAYQFRYPDDLEIGFNISLNQAKLLAELDRSIFEIANRFQFRDNDRVLLIDQSALKKEPRYEERNIVANPAEKNLLFDQPSQSYDFRNMVPIFFEANYLSPSVPDDGYFDMEGLTIGPNSGFILGQPRGEGKMFLANLF